MTYLEINNNLATRNNIKGDVMSFWKSIYSRYGRPPYDTYWRFLMNKIFITNGKERFVYFMIIIVMRYNRWNWNLFQCSLKNIWLLFPFFLAFLSWSNSTNLSVFVRKLLYCIAYRYNEKLTIAENDFRVPQPSSEVVFINYNCSIN